MRPKSLSATAGQVYEECPARYNAEFIERVPNMAGEAALLGTACHEVLEAWVAFGYYTNSSHNKFSDMKDLWDEVYPRLFAHRNRYQEGLDLLRTWYMRQEWSNRTVLSTEVKKGFDIPTSQGPLRFNYVMDRMDQMDDGAIEVVDYKTLIQPVTPDQLREKLQARCYGVAAQIEYPDAPAIWVTFDLLRYDTVSVRYTREDNIATWKYLRKLAERILDDDGTEERLNPSCRWCIRFNVCTAVEKIMKFRPTLALTDPQAAADQRAYLAHVHKALEVEIDRLDEFIIGHMEAEQTTEFRTSAHVVEAQVRGRRKVDAERVAAVLGPEIMARYGTIGVGAIDKIMKEEKLSDDQRYQLKQLVRKVYGDPFIVTKPINENEVEE